MIHPILWKEWREQRWKLAFGTVMLAGFTGSVLAAQVATGLESMTIVCVIGGMLLGLYSAMGVFAPERTNGTLGFLAAKPAAGWKVFISKWFVGWLNVAVPVVAAGLMTGLFFGPSRPKGTSEADFLFRGILCGVGMSTVYYSMTCCFAPRRMGEASVGFVGLLVFLAMLMHWYVLEMRSVRAFVHFDLGFIAIINPLYWVLITIPGHENDPPLWIIVTGQSLVLAAVLGIGLWKWKRSL